MLNFWIIIVFISKNEIILDVIEHWRKQIQVYTIKEVTN